MEKFIEHKGLVAPLPRENIDTDQIIPKQFLKRVERSGYENFLFYDWRFKDGKPTDFILNVEPYTKATILLTGRNFGCGSSREHAVWALKDFGFKAIISEKFADIFYENAFKNGLLLITLPKNEIEKLFEREKEMRPYYLTINLEKEEIRDDFGLIIKFEIDKFRKIRLLEGLDDIAITLKYEDKIREFEERMKSKN